MIYQTRDLAEDHQEQHELSLGRSGIMDGKEVEIDQTMRPTVLSGHHEKNKLNFLKQKSKNHDRQIQLLKL